MPGLRCGQSTLGDFCKIKEGHDWKEDTDCCYKPSKYIIVIKSKLCMECVKLDNMNNYSEIRNIFLTFSIDIFGR